MTKVERKCQYCGRKFSVKPSRAEKGKGLYCSVFCYGRARSKLIRGKNHHLWKEKVEIICEVCGKPFEVKPSLAKRSKYCSIECMGKGRSQKYKRENHPNWGGRIKKRCGVCGKDFEVKPYLIKKGMGKYCSKECRYNAHSKKMSGKSNPRWNSVQQTCQYCKKTFEISKSQLKYGYGKYCSKICASKAAHLTMAGVNNPHWKGATENRTCEQCGNQFIFHKNLTSPEKQTAGRFCSRACMYKWRSNNLVGQSAIHWQGGPVSTKCGNCGKKMAVPRNRIESSDGGNVFCSTKCFHDWHSKNIRGERHFAWKNGASYQPYCEKFDIRLKERVRAFFDRKCLLCGIEEKELHEKLIVHHVFTEKMACCESKINEMDMLRKRLPLDVAKFGEPDFTELEITYIRMMIPICRSCHGISHGRSNEGKYRKYFSNIIIEKYNGKCYYSKDEFNLLEKT